MIEDEHEHNFFRWENRRKAMQIAGGDAFFTENTRIAAEMPSNNKASQLDKTHP